MTAIRRVLTHVEDIFHEFGPPPAQPLRRGAAIAVIENPFAGRFEPEISAFMDELKPLGLELARRVLGALAIAPTAVQGYGKAAIVGASGELEHGALWHVPGGYGMREVLGWQGDSRPSAVGGQRGNALAIVPSTKKVGPPGAQIDVPLTHVNASYVRSHLDAIEVRVPGAPAADEIAFILAMSTGPRVHARLGGLRVDQIDRWDGQC
jgi:Amino acid synthesis